MDFKKLIRKRRSVKKFHFSKKVDYRDIIDAIDNARFIPAAGNLFNLKYILIKNKELIDQLAIACQQEFIKDANYVVAVVSDPEMLTRVYGEIGERYTAQQAGASIENFLLGLTEKNLATTWVGFFYEEMVKQLLDVPEKLVVEGLFPIGVEGKHNTRTDKTKKDLDNVIFFDTYGNKLMEPRSRFPVDSP